MINLLIICVGILLFYGCSKNPEEGKKLQSHTLSAEAIKYIPNRGFAREAIEKAAQNNKYLFLFFYNKGDENCKKMAQVIENAKSNLSSKADFYGVDVADSNEVEVVKQYGIDRSPIPITLVMAPNGAIVAGFPGEVNEDQLRNAFVSPKMAEIVKTMQDRKLVYLYIANRSMKYYKENLALLQETAKVDLRGFASVIEVDPQDKKESSLLKQCRIETPVKEPNLFILNGGRIVGQLAGEFVKQVLLARTMSGCGEGGSTSGSCCPK